MEEEKDEVEEVEEAEGGRVEAVDKKLENNLFDAEFLDSPRAEVVTGGRVSTDVIKSKCFPVTWWFLILGINARGELLTAGISIRYLSPDFPFLILSDTLPGKKIVSHSTNLKLIQNYSNINNNNDLE